MSMKADELDTKSYEDLEKLNKKQKKIIWYLLLSVAALMLLVAYAAYTFKSIGILW